MPRVGLWGTFDVERLGDMLVPRITRRELAHRLPHLVLDVRSPLGFPGRNRFAEEGEQPARPLGDWDDVDVLADDIDLLLLAGPIVPDHELASSVGAPASETERRRSGRFFVEGVGAREVDLPTVWHLATVPSDPDEELAARLRAALAARAIVSVADDASRDRLRAAGVEREIDVVPHPAWLLPRLFDVRALEAWVDHARSTGLLPQADLLAVQASTALAPHLDAFADAVAKVCAARGLTPLLVPTEPADGDDDVARALAARLPEAVRLPEGARTLETVAAIVWSAAFVGDSTAGNVVAAAYGRPSSLVDPAGHDLPPGLETRATEDPSSLAEALDRALGAADAVDPGALRDRVDAHLDRVAALAASLAEAPHLDAPAPVVAGSSLDDERERYARAARALTARMGQQQVAFADRERDLEDWLRGFSLELSQKDVRFTLLWHKVHQADLHYHFHKERADRHEEEIARLQKELDWLRKVTAVRERQLEAARERLSDVTRRPWKAIRSSNYEGAEGEDLDTNAPPGEDPGPA
ncbi:MAG: hypothetical protein ACM3OO_10080 [Planctomycetaceae bacterium]